MTKFALIISPDYPPTNRSSSLRAYFFAQALKEAGYIVNVLAELSATGDAQLPRPDTGVNVVRIYAPNRVIWLAKALFHVALMAIKRRRVDLVISTCGPFLTHAVGRFAKRTWPSAFWVGDYRDLWSTGSYYSDSPQPWPKARQFIERTLLKPCDLITTVSEGLRKNLRRFHENIETLVFYNGYDPGLKSGLATPCSTRVVRICHTGSLYADRSPLSFMEALRVVHEKNIGSGKSVELVLAGAIDNDVKRVVAEFSSCPYIKYVGVLSRTDSYQLQYSSDYCLLLEDPDASRKGVLTGKIFEYLGMRRRIIAFGIAEDSELASILRKSGLLAYCGSEMGDLEEFLSRRIFRPDTEVLPAPDEDFILRFDRSEISRAFVSAVSSRADVAGAHD